MFVVFHLLLTLRSCHVPLEQSIMTYDDTIFFPLSNCRRVGADRINKAERQNIYHDHDKIHWAYSEHYRVFPITQFYSFTRHYSSIIPSYPCPIIS